jgi:hypothetical protein
VYFLILRSPLLPEDLRFLELRQADIDAAAPRLAPWLSHVFRVLSGYALATGALTVVLATTAYRRREPAAVAGSLIAGLSGIGLMALTNFAINSDFRWVLLALALLWFASLVCFVVESWNVLQN